MSAFIGRNIYATVAIEKNEERRIMPTSFDDLLAGRLRDPEFARHYATEAARIAVIDHVVNVLDELRESAGLSKAELARAIGSEPSTVRRLLSAQTVNPTLGTVAELAAALGMKVTLEPMSDEERKRFTEPMVACA
jgi:ribosome-binding protein aMBF1 (putative translation factor)